MKLIQPSFEIYPYDMEDNSIEHMIKRIEVACRKCYKSEARAFENIKESAKWIANIAIERKHQSILEHSSITVDFIFDRGISHELVRHRHTAFSQESTRYCNYSKDKFNNEINVIQPFFFDFSEPTKLINVPKPEGFSGNIKLVEDNYNCGFQMNQFDVWFLSCLWVEWGYNTLINEFGAAAQEARSVLPNSLKTEIRTTANIREWRHILSLRAAGTTGKPHPQIVEVMLPLLLEFQKKIPVLFDDIVVEAEKRGLLENGEIVDSTKTEENK
jgi:thymidylate synthase (FAD)